jgi:hypothetical protein
MRWGARDMSNGPTVPSYEIQFENFSDHLYVYVKIPKLSEQAVMAYIRDIADEAAKRKHRRILLVRDIQGSLPDMVNYRLSQTTSEWLHGIKVAWVNPHPEHHAAMQFFTDVASNRGALYKLFTDVDAARKWLLR